MYTPENPLLIGITGFPRSGKSLFTKYLPQVSGLETAVVEGSTVIRAKYFNNRTDLSRTEFGIKADEIGPDRLNLDIFEVVDAISAPIKCISGIRIFPSYLEIAKRKGIFVVIESEPEQRIQRSSEKIDEINLNLEEMLERDFQGRELIIHALTRIADYKIQNNGTEADFLNNMHQMWQLIQQGRIPFRLTLPS